MNPDCRDGKHHSCAGDGWDQTADAAAPCNCPCHTSATGTLRSTESLLAGLGMVLAPFQKYHLRAALMQQRKAQDPERYKAALALAGTSIFTFEELWDSRLPTGQVAQAFHVPVRLIVTGEPDQRQHALAATAARGTGPRSSASWRGNERTTKYRNQ